MGPIIQDYLTVVWSDPQQFIDLIGVICWLFCSVWSKEIIRSAYQLCIYILKQQERGIISPWFIIMHPHIIFEFINHHQIHKYWYSYGKNMQRKNDFHIDNSYNDYATFRWFLIFDIYHSHYHGTPLCTDDSSRCLSSLTVHYHWLSDKIPTKN